MMNVTKYRMYSTVIMTLFFLFAGSCKKESKVSAPVLTTTEVSKITISSATCGGSITLDGGSAISERGVCWSTGETPTVADGKTIDGQGTGPFSVEMTGLTANTYYHVRAYAMNSADTAYGSVLSFHTWSGTVTDIDGNTYYTVTIGDQEWMGQNLKTTRFNDSTSIPLVESDQEWFSLGSPGYCWYDNKPAYGARYGALYNESAASNPKLAPIGWHVPTASDWSKLISYLGGLSVAGGKMKEEGTAHWPSPNTGATNESGFTAISGCWRADPWGFLINSGGDGWSENEALAFFWTCDGCLMRLRQHYTTAELPSSWSMLNWGFSVRCVKD
jgi:uncharacterized protein (TIGR02145 family)